MREKYKYFRNIKSDLFRAQSRKILGILMDAPSFIYLTSFWGQKNKK
jgi:hypothetical protein